MATLAEQWKAQQQTGSQAPAAPTMAEQWKAQQPAPQPQPQPQQQPVESGTRRTRRDRVDTATVQTPEEMEEEARIAAEEAALREKQAERAPGESALDMTIDAAGVVLNPISDLYNMGRRAVGAEPVERMTDVLKSAVRDTETGFKVEEGVRRTARELMMIPAVPSAMTAITAGLYDMAMNDADVATMMYNDEGRELLLRAETGDEMAAQQLAENPTDYMQPGANFLMSMAETTEEVSGVAQREDGRVPVDEEVAGIIGSMFVGLPVGAVRAAASKMTSMFGDKAVDVATQLAQNKTARVAARTMEVLTPVTVPLSDTAGGYAGAVALNSAAGVAINDAMRYAMNEDTAVGALVEGARDVPPEAAMVSILGAAGVVAAWRRPSRLRGIITGNAPQPLNTGQLPANSLTDIETDVFDADRVAIRTMETIFGKDSPEVQTTLDALRLNTRQAGSVRIDASWEEGIAPGGPGQYYTDPGAQIVEAADSLNVQQRQIVSEGLLAQDILWTTQQAGRRNPSNWSMADLQARSDALNTQIKKVPEIRTIVEAYRTHTRELLEQAHKAGYFTADQMTEMRTRPYVPNVPYETEKNVSAYRALFSGRNRFANQATSPFTKFRQGETMDFTDPFTSLGIYEKSMTQQILENRTRKNYVYTMMRGFKGMSKDKIQETFPNGVPIRRLGKSEKAENTIDVWDGGKQVKYVVGDPALRNSLMFAPHSSAQLLAQTKRMFQVGTTGEFNPLFAPTSLQLDTFFGAMNVKRNEVGGLVDSLLQRAPALRNNIVGDVVSAAIRPVDAAAAAVIGVGRSAMDRVTGELASQMARRLSSTGLASDLGEDGLQGMARMMLNRWHKTATYQMQAQGYAPGRFSADIGDMEPGRFDALMRAMFETNLPGRAYRGLLNSIRDGWRTQYFTMNRAKLLREDAAYQKVLKDADAIGYNPFDSTLLDGKKTPAQLKIDGRIEQVTYGINKRVARLARDIGSDPTRGGQSPRVNEIVGAMPYANVGMQSMHTFYKNLKENPMTRLTMLSYGAWGIGTTAMLLESGGGEWWFERVPDNIRARTLPFNPAHMRAQASGEPYEFDPSDVILIDLGPEGAMVKSAVAGAFEYMTGLPHHASWRDNAWQQRWIELGQSMMTVIPLGVPPIVNVGTSGYGVGPVNPSRMFENRGLFNNALPGQGLGSPDRREIGSNEGPLMTDRIADTLASVFGVFGRTMGEYFEQVEGSMKLNGVGVAEGMADARGALGYDIVERQVPRIWNRAQSPSRSAPVISEAYEIRRLLDPISDQAQIEKYGYVGAQSEPVLRTWPARLPDRLPDTPEGKQARAMLQQIEVAWNGDPVIGDAFDQLSKLRGKYNEVEARRDLPPAERQRLLEGVTMEIQEASSLVVQRVSAFEQSMSNQIGDDFSLTDFISDVNKMLKDAPPQTVN